MDTKILIIDIETTGFHPKDCIILEVGLVELDLVTGKRKIIFDSTCHNKRNFLTRDYIEDSWVVKKGYMTVEEIRRSPDFETIKDEIQAIVNKYPNGATAYNRIFDMTFLEYYGITFPKLLPCPMLLSTNIVKAPHKNPRHGGYKWPSVEEAWRHFFPDIEYDEIHRGADDAYHEASIVYELYKLKKFKL